MANSVPSYAFPNVSFSAFRVCPQNCPDRGSKKQTPSLQARAATQLQLSSVRPGNAREVLFETQ